MELIPSWLKPARATSAVGIYLTSNCLIAIDEQEPSNTVQRNVSQGESIESSLRAFVEEQKWQGRRLHLVLSRDWYHQHAIDKPPMPDEELQQALPWCMRELVNEPVETLLFDYLDLPAGPNGQARIAVYSCPKEPLAGLVRAVTPQCEIATIGVDEIAMTNLFAPDERALFLYKMPGQELTMTFIHQRRWHFSRPIRGFQALDDAHSSADQFVFDNLLLELQRSIDYAVGQLKLDQPERWYLALPADVTPLLQESINQVFGIAAESITSTAVMSISLPAMGILREGKA